HGQMQHDLIATAVGFFRDLAGIGVKGEEGKSEWVREGEDGLSSRAIGAEIVKNDGKTRNTGAHRGLRMRRDVSLSCITRPGTEIPSRFGIVASGEANKHSEQKKCHRPLKLFPRARKKVGHERTKRPSSPDSSEVRGPCEERDHRKKGDADRGWSPWVCRG